MALGLPTTSRSVIQEGDSYEVIDAMIGIGVSVECLIDSGQIYSLTVTSQLVRDEKGMGVGSTLSELRGSYPSGRLLVGEEDGRFANFVNGSKVVFALQQEAIDPTCFEPMSTECAGGGEVAVMKVVVNSERANWIR